MGPSFIEFEDRFRFQFKTGLEKYRKYRRNKYLVEPGTNILFHLQYNFLVQPPYHYPTRNCKIIIQSKIIIILNKGAGGGDCEVKLEQ